MQTKNDVCVINRQLGPDTSITKLCIKQMGFSIAGVSATNEESADDILETTLNRKQVIGQREFKQRVCQSIYPYMPYDLDDYAIKSVHIVGFCEPKEISVQQQCISFSDFNLILEVQYKENQQNIDDETLAEIRGEILDLLHIDLVFEQMAFEMNYIYDVAIMDIDNLPADMTLIPLSMH